MNKSVTVVLESRIASEPTMEIKINDELVPAKTLLRMLLPYAEYQHLHQLLATNFTDTELKFETRTDSRFITVDAKSLPPLKDQKDPDFNCEEWLNCIIERCRIVREQFEKEFPAKYVSVTKDVEFPE